MFRPAIGLPVFLAMLALASISHAHGTHGTLSDGQILVPISKETKGHILIHMRGRLHAVRSIVIALVSSNFNAALGAISEGFKYPPEEKKDRPVVGNRGYKVMELGLRREVGYLVKAIEKKDIQKSWASMGGILDLCVRCHDTYTFMQKL